MRRTNIIFLSLLATGLVLAAGQADINQATAMPQGPDPLPAAAVEKPAMISESGPDAGVGPVFRRGGAATSGSQGGVRPLNLGSNIFQWAWSDERVVNQLAGDVAASDRDCPVGRQLVSCFCR